MHRWKLNGPRKLCTRSNRGESNMQLHIKYTRIFVSFYRIPSFPTHELANSQNCKSQLLLKKAILISWTINRSYMIPWKFMQNSKVLPYTDLLSDRLWGHSILQYLGYMYNVKIFPYGRYTSNGISGDQVAVNFCLTCNKSAYPIPLT